VSLEIEKNIPIPARKRKWKETKWMDILRSMEVGDSVLLETHQQYKSIHNASTVCFVKIEARWMDDGIRVWRIA
jgi:hypothetical protein